MIRDQEPIFRFAHFYFGANRRDRLVWGVHHLAVDAVFRCILLEDLFSAYRYLRLHWTSQWLKLEPNAAIVDDQVCIFWGETRNERRANEFRTAGAFIRTSGPSADRQLFRQLYPRRFSLN